MFLEALKNKILSQKLRVPLCLLRMRNYSQLSDFDLAELLREGKESAFREIYTRYWDKLYVTARKRLHDEAEAEEVVQDIFCNLWRKRFSFSLSKTFDHYFAVAVKFEVINRMARKARHTLFEQEAHRTFSDMDYSTLEELNLAELKRQLESSISSLPDKCRIVFRLKYEKDYSQREIAEELQISEKTVEAHLAKARKVLRGNFGSLLGMLISLL